MDAVELLATEKLSGGGRVDKSGESARRAARRSLSLAVKAAAIIGSVSSGPANLKNSCEFVITFHTFHRFHTAESGEGGKSFGHTHSIVDPKLIFSIRFTKPLYW